MKEPALRLIPQTQRILRHYYEQIYANKQDNLEEAYKFIEIDNLQKLNSEEIKKSEKPISKEIESVSKNYQTKETVETDGFIGDFCLILKDVLTFLKCIQKH